MVPQPEPRLTRSRSFAVAGAFIVALAPTAVRAQVALLDSLRPVVESAVTRGDQAAIDLTVTRLRTAAAGPGARDPWTHYDLGYVLHRRASAMLLAKKIDLARPLLEESERALARAQELGGGAAATALRGAVTGQLAGTGGMVNAMRMGPRSFKLLDEAVAAAPRDARVALLNGMSRLNAPRAFGGGPAKGEPELRRAVALFADDRPTGGAPAWGRVDAHIWLGIALEQLGRRDEARAELQRALALAPGHAWVTRELLPKLDAQKPR
ncbi:MAG: tetratricopeptide repeat protein [Gemmatimonadetes bacterium]|nr:tetratricopeptide repeat protein [Gemmatimonadota bacterium]